MVSSADRQHAPDGDGENSSMSSVTHSGLRKCPTQRESRSERSGSPRSAKWQCPLALPWFQSPQHPVPSLPSLLPALVIVFWWQSHSKASESYAVSRAWNCLLKLSAEGKFTAVGALREKHGKGLPETASSAVTGCFLRAPFTTLRGWEVPDTDVEACPYSCWWPWIFPEI